MATAETIFRQFEKKINSLQELDKNGESGFAREFQALRQTSFKYKGNKSYSTKAGESPINRPKNRFKDILPFDYTRVTLPKTDDNGSDYINANFIKGVDGEKVYIASQGPLPNTVNDFWRMLWTYKVKVLVMLCREEENGKKKCERYWCENDEKKLNFGGIVVKTERCIGVGDDFIMRTLVAEFQGEKLMITQFHYTAWPDHGVPTTALPLIELIKLVREYQPEGSPPIVLHCSAGCGRTGTICALDYTRSLLKDMKYKDLVPYRIVEILRKQRHAMVQTKGQYEFLCRAMCALFRAKLNLPIEEDHEDHLYENVVPITPSSDSDSDFTPSSPIFFQERPVQQKSKQNAETLSQFSAAKVDHKKRDRVGQVTQQNPTENYVNVAFDLIDLSDSKPKVKNSCAANPSNSGSRDTTHSWNDGKIPLTRQSSVPDNVSYNDTSTDYVVVPSREPQKTSRSLPCSTKYENIQPGSQTRLPASSRPVISQKPSSVHSATPKYENVEVPSFTSANSGRKSPNNRAGKPAAPNKSLEFSRSQSASTNLDVHPPAPAPALHKFSTCGPSLGVKYADQIKAMNGLQRARVLPNEEMHGGDKVVANDNELSSLTKSGRRPINESTFKNGEIVNGERAPAVSRKSVELLATDKQHHELGNETKSTKPSSLTKKIPFSARRPEITGTTLEHIGYGKRVPKPNGPRSPPLSWRVKS